MYGASPPSPGGRRTRKRINHYQIYRVTDIRQAAAMRAGGQGDRYTVMINGQRSYLFFERSAGLTGPNIGRWFVERKQ